MKIKQKKKRREDSNVSPVGKIAIGAAISATIFFALIALFAYISLESGMNTETYLPAGLFIALLSGIAGGFAAVKPIKEKGAFYGVLSGLSAAIITSLILFAVNDASAGNGIFITAGLMIAGGILGGILAVNLKIKKKY